MSNPSGRPRIYPDVSLVCRQCQQPFAMRGSLARGYEKKHGRPKPFCSMRCFYEASERHPRDLTEVAPTYVCAGCGETVNRRRDMSRGARVGNWDYRQKYCSVRCHQEHRFATYEAERAEGKLAKGHINRDGYHVVKLGREHAVRMHRYEMEKFLGRALRGNENVHHINGDRSDNRLENLELWVKTQPCGQRVTDRVNAAISLLRDYPEIAEAAGFRLIQSRGG